MSVSVSRLERRYRRLLRSYPAAWRRRHEEEMIGVLLDQSETSGRSTVSAAAALDLVGHGAEERVEGALRWLPVRLRRQVATVALVAAARLSLLMLVGEMIGAYFRSVDPSADGGLYLDSGPFLTIGVGMYLAVLTAFLLVVRGHGGFARLLLLAAVAYALWMRWPVFSPAYPAPRLMVLVLFVGLGLLAALVTLRPGRRAARGLAGYEMAFVGVVVMGVLLSRSVMGWSVGTLATSGNVALAVLATVLPFVGGAAVLVAARNSHRHPGWPAAIAVAAFPLVVFCTLVSQSVNPVQADGRALFPLFYALVVLAVTLLHHGGRRQTARSATWATHGDSSWSSGRPGAR